VSPVPDAVSAAASVLNGPSEVPSPLAAVFRTYQTWPEIGRLSVPVLVATPSETVYVKVSVTPVSPSSGR
jgi:hypothetical protein